MAAEIGRVIALKRFPVKGLSPEHLDEVEAEAGRPLAGDRVYAIENGPSGFDPDNAVKLPKTKFLCLMRNERLARLKTRYDHETAVLTVDLDGAHAFAGDLSSETGRGEAERFFTGFMGEEARGELKVLPAPAKHTFSDTALGVLSLINLASVAAVEDFAGRPIDPLRFRGNVDFEGFAPWAELDWVGREVAIGAARFRIVQRTVRCGATEVDPQTGERDIRVPKLLQQNLGHADCGVYAEAIEGGRIAVGDPVRLV